MVPTERYSLFIGQMASPPLPPGPPNGYFNLFTGQIASSALPPGPPSTHFNVFVGYVAYMPIPAGPPSARFNLFTNAMVAPGPVVGTGIVLYPISEDPNQRPPLRY